jgi:hypothetical protein
VSDVLQRATREERAASIEENSGIAELCQYLRALP